MYEASGKSDTKKSVVSETETKKVFLSETGCKGNNVLIIHTSTDGIHTSSEH